MFIKRFIYHPEITNHFVLVKLKHELANLKDTKRVCIFTYLLSDLVRVCNAARMNFD